MMKNEEILEFERKISGIPADAGNDDLRTSRKKKNYKEMSDEGDLLYEFPAETRLTVDRRLDIRVQL